MTRFEAKQMTGLSTSLVTGRTWVWTFGLEKIMESLLVKGPREEDRAGIWLASGRLLTWTQECG
jgi:hypothetical protein